MREGTSHSLILLALKSIIHLRVNKSRLISSLTVSHPKIKEDFKDKPSIEFTKKTQKAVVKTFQRVRFQERSPKSNFWRLSLMEHQSLASLIFSQVQ
jgi:hypothetical protein